MPKENDPKSLQNLTLNHPSLVDEGEETKFY